MNSFITYIFEFNIALSVIFLVYILVFRKDSNFGTRRTYLFVAMLLSFIFPVVHISLGNGSSGMSAPIITLDEVIVFSGASELISGASFNLLQGLVVGYLIISALFMIKILSLVLSVFFHAARSNKILISGTPIILSSRMHASSFFHLIFLDPEQVDENNMSHIIEHEKHHANLLHSLDRIMAEFILAFSWANPMVWMFRKAVITNHEYQADNRVITYGTDKVSYQLSMLNQSIGSASISNQFSSQIKNRIMMLNKNYSKGSFWKTLLLIPTGLVLFFFLSCNNEGSEKKAADKDATPVEEQLFYVVEEMPQWPGADDMSMEVRKFIAQNLAYPPEAVENGVQGKVFVHFVVTKTGKVIIPEASQLPPEKTEEGVVGEVVVAAYKTINEGDPEPEEKYIQLLKDEAIRVIGLLPDMVPGKQRGNNVNVVFTMPISFVLQ